MACTLFRMLCESGCRASHVASSLAFLPPDPPTYMLRRKKYATTTYYGANNNSSSSSNNNNSNPNNNSNGGNATNNTNSNNGSNSAPTSGTSTSGYEWILDEEIDPIPWPDTIITEVRTKRQKLIPIFVFLYPQANLTILLSHGNAVDCGLVRATAIDLAINLRVNVVLYDYTGYGSTTNNDGSVPSELDTYADIDAVYEYILRAGTSWGFMNPGNQLILIGQSLGSGPSIYLASKKSIAGLILLSPIASGIRVLVDDNCTANCLCCCDIFPNLTRMKKIQAGAVLIVHGMRDHEVHISHGKRIYDALPQRYRVPPAMPVPWNQQSSSFIQSLLPSGVTLPNDPFSPYFPTLAGHNDIQELYRSEFFIRLRAFFLVLPTLAFSPVSPMGALSYLAAPLHLPHNLHPHATNLLAVLTSGVSLVPCPGSEALAKLSSLEGINLPSSTSDGKSTYGSNNNTSINLTSVSASSSSSHSQNGAGKQDTMMVNHSSFGDNGDNTNNDSTNNVQGKVIIGRSRHSSLLGNSNNNGNNTSNNSTGGNNSNSNSRQGSISLDNSNNGSGILRPTTNITGGMTLITDSMPTHGSSSTKIPRNSFDGGLSRTDREKLAAIASTNSSNNANSATINNGTSTKQIVSRAPQQISSSSVGRVGTGGSGRTSSITGVEDIMDESGSETEGKSNSKDIRTKEYFEASRSRRRSRSRSTTQSAMNNNNGNTVDNPTPASTYPSLPQHHTAPPKR